MILLSHLSKSFGGVRALSDVSLELRPGEVHALCGENGAGKSTLNRILAGAIIPDSGSVALNGKPLLLGSVRASAEAGIAMVHQETPAFLHLNAIENHQIMQEPLGLGGLWLDRAAMAARAQASLKSIGEEFDLAAPLSEKSIAQRQMVAIAKALQGECRLLILDEPTSSLSTREAEALFLLVSQIKQKGVAVLYVSHRMEEIFLLSDRVTVLRDGCHVATLETSETTREDLVRLMVGRAIETDRLTEPRTPGPTLIEAKGLTRRGFFDDISLKVRSGEVVALAGLVGAGRSEVARAIFGLDALDAGEVNAKGRIAFLPEDRHHEGIHLPLSILENLSMARRGGFVISRREESERAARLIQELSIKTPSEKAEASSLSGGNQQKVLLGKWLATDPQILILDEPTRGVDVGAKDQIHRLIQELAGRGMAVLLISSEMAEVQALADRVLVMRQGELAGELPRVDATQERILELALPKEKDAVKEQRSKAAFPLEALVAGILLLALMGVGLTNPAFLAGDNIRDILVKAAPALIVGSMMTLVILAREIDISVGSLMGLCAAVLGIATSTDRLALPVWAGVILCLAVGAGVGLINGVLTAFARIPSIVVTLGMLTLLKGATELLMGGRWIENMPQGLRAFGTESAMGIPYSVWMALASMLIGIWLTRRTAFGLRTYALGSSPSAAELRGIDGRKMKLVAFALTGLAAGAAALFSATQLQVIESGFGSGFELVVIAGVIVGGTSIRGGRGSVIGTAIGALLLGMVSTALIFMKLGESATYWERAIQGGVILLAIIADHLGRRGKAE